jgi:hypothetical protein
MRLFSSDFFEDAMAGIVLAHGALDNYAHVAPVRHFWVVGFAGITSVLTPK